MNEPAILPVKPGTINAKDKAALSKAGVIVVEHDDPGGLRLIKVNAELDGWACLLRQCAG